MYCEYHLKKVIQILYFLRSVTVDRRDGSFGFILRGSNPVYIESVDINGAADRAGLKAGQCILRLNGLDVR
jgi:S1-C subfamily serine protease